MDARRLKASVLSVLVVLLCSCATHPSAPSGMVLRPADPAFLHGTDGGRADRLAATVVTEVQRYWATEFPAVFGHVWRNLDGGFFSVDTTRMSGQPPPCSASNRDVEGNAYYCATVDAVAWDRSALLPVLREHYGEGAVMAVLAHELGHAVQKRAGIDVGDPVQLEAMADCYAGSFARWAADGQSARLRVGPEELDAAMQALTVFRDPVGTSASEAHGSAFDRVTAFTDGFQQGPHGCADVHPLVRVDGAERQRSLDSVIASPGMRSYFANLVDGAWSPPRPVTDPAARCAESAVAYCPPSIVIDRKALASVHYDLGDQAAATLLASRYALAALDGRGAATEGIEAARNAACLTGAYTASRVDGPLSRRDLDAATEALLAHPSVSHDTSITDPLGGLARVAAFRDGFSGGSTACGAF